ncbi:MULTISPECIES: MarR family transcriptional regulator [unclassified Achromobacter]|uniref:MarR family winged helix-turn-helix transcriptional regulator n=1 Tax=unclassified Achromobacter TaxID=2626865 RepID=UPI00069F601B|nr:MULTISPECIES: MarR family transcriptional regulator [unclassified Achromobacter]
MTDNPDLKGLQSRRSKGLSRLLLLARRNFVLAIGNVISETGNPSVPDSCMMLLPHIDLEGTRSTEIAQRAGMTKQAVTQLIQLMERHGLVQKLVDPHDARATLVSFTDQGIEYLTGMHAAIDRVEHDLASKLGKAQMKNLRAALEIMAYQWRPDANRAGRQVTGRADAKRMRPRGQ